MSEVVERKMACGHVERHTLIGWALREGLVTACRDCILRNARAGAAESFERQAKRTRS